MSLNLDEKCYWKWNIQRKWKFSTILLLCNYTKTRNNFHMNMVISIKWQILERQKWSNKGLCKNINIVWTKLFSLWFSYCCHLPCTKAIIILPPPPLSFLSKKSQLSDKHDISETHLFFFFFVLLKKCKVLRWFLLDCPFVYRQYEFCFLSGRVRV